MKLLSLSLMLMAFSCYAANTRDKMITCDECNGRGFIKETCPDCRGAGGRQDASTARSIKGYHKTRWEPCGRCGKIGEERGKIKVKCHKCDGTKKMTNPDYDPTRNSTSTTNRYIENDKCKVIELTMRDMEMIMNKLRKDRIYKSLNRNFEIRIKD